MSDLELTMMRRVGELNKENAALKAENARLKTEVERAGHRLENLNVWYDEALDKNDNLKAEVERLTKAGDAFVILLEDEGYDMESIREVEAWNAAKEGKPHA